MADTLEMLKIRDEMKSTMREFNRINKIKSQGATEFNKARIIGELKVLADQFAKKYNDLQSKYTELMFYQDLKEIVGKDKADLFLKVQMLRDTAKNN